MAAKVGEEREGQIIFKTTAINTGIEAGTEERLTRDPLCDFFRPYDLQVVQR
ncbi:Uncharacterised protein [Yersinia mollaretii]|nr:hypothetical protein [Yersinia mollaretii]CNI77936.1 Uncharacterised protein [Yersinia mollaretii]CQQ45823.1 Uncharacterised protein [Yersinia mollaretii]